MEAKSNAGIKAIVIGDTAVGKTTLICVMDNPNSFDDKKPSTIGTERKLIPLLCENKEIKIELWDTAGQEMYRSLIPMYTRNAKIVLIVFDLTVISSIDNIVYGDKPWVDSFKSELTPGEYECFLVGTKCDLEEERTVTDEKIEEIRSEITCRLGFNEIPYIQISSKTKENIESLKTQIAEKAQRFQVEPPQTLEEKEQGCC